MQVIIQRDYTEMSKTAEQIVVEVLNTTPNAVLGEGPITSMVTASAIQLHATRS
jgi:hypothetical protein